MTPTGFIDPPGPFDDVDAWRAFVAELKGIAEPSPDVTKALAEAEAEVERRTAIGEKPEDFADLEDNDA